MLSCGHGEYDWIGGPLTEQFYSSMEYTPCELEHRYGSHVHLLGDPVLLSYLSTLCSPATVQPQINDYIQLCYQGLLGRVFAGEFPRQQVQRETRMVAFTDKGHYVGEVIDPKTRVVTVNIARAGALPSHTCFELLNRLIDPAGVRQDHLVMERRLDAAGKVVGADLRGSKIGGDVDGAHLIFPDPMAATGSSLIAAISHYKEEVGGDPTKILAVHVIVTPEYLRAMTQAHPEVQVYAIRLDRGLSPDDVLATVPGTHWDREVGLNERQYIVPGGGGFGEILNNTDA